MQNENARSLISDAMVVTVTLVLLLPVCVIRCIRSSNNMSNTGIA